MLIQIQYFCFQFPTAIQIHQLNLNEKSIRIHFWMMLNPDCFLWTIRQTLSIKCNTKKVCVCVCVHLCVSLPLFGTYHSVSPIHCRSTESEADPHTHTHTHSRTPGGRPMMLQHDITQEQTHVMTSLRMCAMMTSQNTVYSPL